MVIDTSALVALLSGEDEAERCLQRIAGEERPLLSAASYLEAAIVIDSRYGEDGVRDLRLFLHEAGVEVVAVDRDQAEVARKAFQRFGKGRHPAGLNFGDCFVYALAKVRAAPVLFVGDDFSKTDLAGVA